MKSEKRRREGRDIFGRAADGVVNLIPIVSLKTDFRWRFPYEEIMVNIS